MLTLGRNRQRHSFDIGGAVTRHDLEFAGLNDVLHRVVPHPECLFVEGEGHITAFACGQGDAFECFQILYRSGDRADFLMHIKLHDLIAFARAVIPDRDGDVHRSVRGD